MIDQLIREFPELRDWARGDLIDMLGSVSPYMSDRNWKIQQRYLALCAGGK